MGVFGCSWLWLVLGGSKGLALQDRRKGFGQHELRRLVCQSCASRPARAPNWVECGWKAVARPAGVGCVCSWARVSTDVLLLSSLSVLVLIGRELVPVSCSSSCVVGLRPACGWFRAAFARVSMRFRAAAGPGRLYLFACSSVSVVLELRPACSFVRACSPWAPATPSRVTEKTNRIGVKLELRQLSVVYF